MAGTEVAGRLRRRRKPRLSPYSFGLLTRIDDYIRRHDCRGQSLVAAASDQLDGLVNRDEVEDLVRRRLLTVIPLGEYGAEDRWALSGTCFTVALTPRATGLFWPDRVAAPVVAARPGRKGARRTARSPSE